MDNANGVRKLVWDDKPKICSKCGGVYKFNSHGSYKCSQCGEIAYDDFGKVRKFIDENGPSPAVVIAEATGVTINKINGFLRQGRIEIPEGSGEYIRCENCGGPIRFGKYCPACATSLSKHKAVAIEPGDVGERPKFVNKGKMHTDHSNKGERR